MQAVVLAGNGSRDQGPERRGSPAPDAREPVRRDPPDTRGPLGRLRALFRRFDRAFSRTFTAMAMAEDGTRELALEQLEQPDEQDVPLHSGTASGGPDDEPPTD